MPAKKIEEKIMFCCQTIDHIYLFTINFLGDTKISVCGVRCAVYGCTYVLAQNGPLVDLWTNTTQEIF